MFLARRLLPCFRRVFFQKELHQQRDGLGTFHDIPSGAEGFSFRFRRASFWFTIVAMSEHRATKMIRILPKAYTPLKRFCEREGRHISSVVSVAVLEYLGISTRGIHRYSTHSNANIGKVTR